MWIKGLHINHWVLYSPPLQKFLDFVRVVGEVFRGFPCAIIEGIPVKHMRQQTKNSRHGLAPFPSNKVLDHTLIRYVASSQQAINEIFLAHGVVASRPGAHPTFFTRCANTLPEKKLRIVENFTKMSSLVGYLWCGFSKHCLMGAIGCSHTTHKGGIPKGSYPHGLL